MPLFVRDIGSVLPTKKSAVCAGAEYNKDLTPTATAVYRYKAKNSHSKR